MIEPDKPKIILIAYHFPPGEEIGALRPYRFYKYLQRIGFQCHVITASEPSNPCPPEVIWVPDTLASNWDGSSNGKRSRMAYFELLLRKFMFPGHLGLTWSFEAARRCHQIIGAHPEQKVVVFSTYPPLGVLFAGLLVRRRTAIPWISDFRDPLDVKHAYVSRWRRYCNSLVERTVFRAADFIIANTQSAAEMWAARFPWGASKLGVIWNGFDPDERPRARPLPARAQKTIVHAGALTLGRNANRIIESMSRLWRSRSAQAGQTCIVLLGSIEMAKAGLNREVCEQGQHDGWLKLIPPVPRAEAQRITEEADGLLVVQPHTKVQVPGKLFEYLCIGRPILALVPPQSAIEYILSKAGVPYVCIFTDDEPALIDRKLLYFLSLPADPVPYSEWFATNFNADQQANQLVSIIDAVAVGKATPSN